MKQRIHALAGTLAFFTIAVFWISTAVSELFGSPSDIAAVKQSILWGLLILVPALIATGGTGTSLAYRRAGPKLDRKKRRMPVIAANGLMILVPSAFFLAYKAGLGEFDTWFYAVQALELGAGAINLTLMALNIRDGMLLSGRIRRNRPSRVET